MQLLMAHIMQISLAQETGFCPGKTQFLLHIMQISDIYHRFWVTNVTIF
jgi:hypothetical protein